MGTFRLSLHWISRLGLGGFFVLAGGVKLWDAGAFQQEILAYQLVGYGIAGVAAHSLPVFELTLGLGLLFGLQMRVGVAIAATLLLVFIAALSWTWAQGIDLRCGCLGSIDFIEGQPAAIGRDLVLLAMALVLWIVPKLKPSGDES